MNIGLVQGSNYSALIKKDGEEKIANIEELSEIEKLENFKKEIWKEIDSMHWGCDISIHITDDAFKRMMDDSDFKDRMLSKIREDASVSGIKGGGTMLNITEAGYSGFSWMDGYPGETSAGFSAHSKNAFYSKKVSHKQDYMELWEERRHEREVQREKLEKAYEEQLYLKQHWARKERATAVYESATIFIVNDRIEKGDE
ncbi:MAG: hypothetical protein E7299_10860 [Lachnospiraceae bacterium]|nr:hypothetical protein [Lachnospiraceae bacterium]